MRWVNFAILVFILLVIQTSIGRIFGLGPQRIAPDLLLILAAVLVFRIGNTESLVACWILGLLKDLSCDSVLGGYALSFGLVGFLVIYLREWLYMEHPLAIMFVVFVSCFAVDQLSFLVEQLKSSTTVDYKGQSFEMLFSALFSAALSPYGQWFLVKLSKPLGINLTKTYAQ